MPYRAMLAQLADLLDEDRPSPPVPELVDLRDRLRACRQAMDRPELFAPGTPWLARRFMDLLERRLAGKPIRRAEVGDLMAAIVDHGRYRALTYAADPYADDRAVTLAVLERIAATCETPACPPGLGWRRRQAAAFGLLSTALASPLTARTLDLAARHFHL